MFPFSKNQQVAYHYLNGKAIALPYGDKPLYRTINTSFFFHIITKIALLQPAKNCAIIPTEVRNMDKKGTFLAPLLVLAAVFAIGALIAILL